MNQQSLLGTKTKFDETIDVYTCSATIKVQLIIVNVRNDGWM